MAENLFEKYGIKDIAEVTLYRIERKDETFESQRKITISSILKSALTKQTVYPLDAEGKGEADGYEAYVFKNADILTHFNYDCDDVSGVSGTATFIDITDTHSTISDVADYLESTALGGTLPHLFADSNSLITSITDVSTGRDMMDRYTELVLTGFDAQDVEVNTTDYETGIQDIAYGDSNSELVTWKSSIVAPKKAYNVTEDDISDISGATWSQGEADLSDAYIVFTAPRNASPEAIRANFATQKAKLQASLGVIVRFTQPTIVTSDDTMSGIWTIAVHDDDNNTDMTTVKIVFSGASVPSNIRSIIKSPTLTEAQLKTFITYKDATPTLQATVESGSDTLTAVAADEAGIYSIPSVSYGYRYFKVKFTASLSFAGELETGNYALDIGSAEGHYAMDRDTDNAGTHEFSYPEQICMLFAKNQNLITKTGNRYQFADADSMFTGFEFNDNFAIAPNSKERIVVVGLADKLSENLYNEREVLEAIKSLTDIIEAKAYNVVYTDYAELVVENEMGYYLPQQLGYAYDKRTKTVSFFDVLNNYATWASGLKGEDLGIESAVDTWGDDKHYSINDAIDALKQQYHLIDGTSEITTSSFDRVFGGYRVVGKKASSSVPLDDLNRVNGGYEDYTINGHVITNLATGQKLSSGYALENVLTALATADLGGRSGQVRINSTAETESNRAIYVDPTSISLSNRANLYILKNVNGRALSADKDGIFEFYDKKGNKLFYQDKVFAGTATLALVTIGSMGLIFVVEQYGKKNIEKIAWMVKDRGYITDKQAKKIVDNGLIHTVNINVCNENFDATCTVGSIKVRKITKNVFHYVPVLFLDTLKVSTLEQASETTDARGGRGNSKLITWDFGKEITLSIEDALFTPASMAAIWGGEDFKDGVKQAKKIDRFQKYTADRNFIVPAGNFEGTPTEGDMTAQAVYYDPTTMEPYQDGTPIAIGEIYYKFTRSVAYGDNSLGKKIEISADKFPGTYRLVGETVVRNKDSKKDQRFQFIIPEGKMSASDASLTLEADGDPVTFSFKFDVLRPESGNMMELIQFDIEDNAEQGDGSDMVKGTEDLNILDDAEMYRVSGSEEEALVIGATEY